jgi:hypothetical protein
MNVYFMNGGRHAHVALKVDCEMEIEKRAKYGQPSWPWFNVFDHYSRGDDFPTTGVITVADQRVTFKNAFNADVHGTAYCTYDLTTNKVTFADFDELE